MYRIGLLLALALILAACGGSGSASDTPGPATTQSAATATVARGAGKLDASGVVDALKAAGMPVGRVMMWTAENDPNKLLGRPNGYTSKVTFTDTRIEPTGGDDAWRVDNGGDVEVFANTDDAKARADYINSIVKASPMLTQYVYVHDRILLRLGKALPPDQAAEYERVLNGL